MSVPEYRKPLKGFESYYSITRDGSVYSERLNRYIQHTYITRPPHYDKEKPHISFTIEGQKFELDINQAIAEAWLSEEQMHEIQNSDSSNMGKEELKKIKKELSKRYDVPVKVINYLIKDRVPK